MKKLIISIIALLLTSFSILAQRSEGTASTNVPGRSSVGSIPRLVISGKADGIVVVDIWVDNYGNVVKAVSGGDGTTVTDKTLWAAARKAAMETHFNMSADAPVTQEGKITYTLTSYDVPEGDNDSFTFVGIPIGGTQDQMIKALERKGFKANYKGELTGMFNGEEVTVRISTNHGIVDRILVEYPYCSAENDTRIKYNMLLSRFARSEKYVCVNPQEEVPVKEELHRRITENSKYYDAVYFYLKKGINADQWVDDFKEEYRNSYNKPLAGLSYEEMEEALFCLPTRISGAVSGVVWFTMINSHEININYINFKNRPRGEDL